MSAPDRAGPPPEGFFAAIARGCPAAAEAFARHYWPIAYRAASRLFPHHDAEDVASEAIRRVWLAAKTRGIAAENELSYVLGAVRNAGSDYLKKRRTMPAGDRPAAADVTEVVRVEVRLDVAAAIARLPDALRRTSELRHVLGQSYQQIATALGVPIGTVRSRLYEALEQLCGLLGSGEERP
jgi:RNA polymerase sigma-70 factor (ECF subfamily)